MKIITAVNSHFMPILGLTMPVNLKHGPMTVYHCDALPTRREKILGRLPRKPEFLLKAWSSGQQMVWLDADAWIIRPFQLAYDFDIAVTMRRQTERGKGSPFEDIYGYINAGVIFINGSQGAIQFMEEWQAEIKNTPSQSDQHALNNLIRQATDLTEYGVTVWRKNVAIRILSTDEFNYYYFDEPVPNTAKILHMKTDLRARHSIQDWTAKVWA